MKTVGIISAAALFFASVSMASAQGASGTAPENKGNTGWTGGAQDQPAQSKDSTKPGETTGQKVEVHDEAKAKDQPPVASGEDLKGPAVQNAPSKTPE
jgi:hypothetical protein